MGFKITYRIYEIALFKKDPKKIHQEIHSKSESEIKEPFPNLTVVWGMI